MPYRDLNIDLQETLKHFNNEHGQRALVGIHGKFSKMDKDGNGVIDPAEFDDDLTQEKISIYNSQKNYTTTV